MQSSIAVLSSIAIFLSTPSKTKRAQGQQKHSQTLLIATIEFQKNQCYFAGAIQIAAIAFLVSQMRLSVISLPELFDYDFLGTLATNGFISTVFNLAVDSVYGRQSWYPVIMTSAVFALSTVVLALASALWDSWYGSGLIQANTYNGQAGQPACGDFGAAALTEPLCRTAFGSSFDKAATSQWLWLLWAHSLL